MSIKLSNYTEPARIRAIVTAVVALCAALGFALPIDLPGAVEVLIPVLSFLLPLIQGESTRAAVVPLEKHKDEVARAAGHVVIPQTPGRPDHAA